MNCSNKRVIPKTFRAAYFYKVVFLTKPFSASCFIDIFITPQISYLTSSWQELLWETSCTINIADFPRSSSAEPFINNCMFILNSSHRVYSPRPPFFYNVLKHILDFKINCAWETIHHIPGNQMRVKRGRGRAEINFFSTVIWNKQWFAAPGI